MKVDANILFPFPLNRHDDATVISIIFVIMSTTRMSVDNSYFAASEPIQCLFFMCLFYSEVHLSIIMPFYLVIFVAQFNFN